METNQVFFWFGAVVSSFGIGLVVWHVRERRRHQGNENLSAEDARFFANQYRRRMQTSALTVTLGALLSLCDTLQVFKDSPVFATWYVMGLLVLALWLVMLAFGDAIASRVHVSQSLRRNRKTQQALQSALAELRRAQEHADQQRESDMLILRGEHD